MFYFNTKFSCWWYVDGDQIKWVIRVEFRSGGDIYYKFKNNVE